MQGVSNSKPYTTLAPPSVDIPPSAARFRSPSPGRGGPPPRPCERAPISGMSDLRRPTDDRLADLSARADALERSTARSTSGLSGAGAGGAAANQAYRILADLIGGVVVGLALGFGVDALAPHLGFRTAPAGLLIGVLSGFAVSVWMAKRTADRLVAQARTDHPNPPSVPFGDGDED